jgi:hypothetical protein
MTRDDIIRMAREAGDVEIDRRGRETFTYDIYGLERFAKLVYEKAWADTALAATHTVTDAAILKEREACAKVCEGRIGGAVQSNEWWAGFKTAMSQCAAAIRARGQA